MIIAINLVSGTDHIVVRPGTADVGVVLSMRQHDAADANYVRNMTNTRYAYTGDEDKAFRRKLMAWGSILAIPAEDCLS